MAREDGVVTINLSDYLDKLQAEQRTHRDKADEITARVVTEDRDFSDDENKALAEHQGKMIAIGKRMETIRKQLDVRGGLDGSGAPKTQSDRKPGERAGGDGDGEQREKAYKSAYTRWLRFGMGGLNDEQRTLMQTGYSELDAKDPEVRAMSTLVGATGGFTVPQGFITDVEKAMVDFSGVRQSRAQVLPTESGNDLPWPTANDTSNEGEMVGENTATSTDAGPSPFGQIMLKGFLFSSKLVLVPIQLLQDSAINIEQFLSGILGERLGRAQNRKFTTGTGVSEPQGIVNGASLGKTAAGAAAITYGELVDLQHSVDQAYRANAEWMFHDSTFALLRKLLDSDGRPIWQPAAVSSMAGGPPSTLLGAPYRINQHMATPATTAKTVLWGDMSKYKIRQIRNMVLVRLTERYAEQFQVGFFAFLRADGRHVNPGNAIKYLQQA